MNFKQITNGQIKQIASEISKRWKFENQGPYYNCIDTKTGQRSIDCGDKNFAHYNFTNAVTNTYLTLIGQDYSYLDWSAVGVDVSNDRKSYISCIACEIEKILCGFTTEGRTLAYTKLLASQN